jgi:hypothetical protein
MKTKFTPCFAAIALMLASASSWATIIQSSVTGTVGNMVGGDPLSASATFTTSEGKIDITLTNTLSADLFRSAGQALSDLSFTLTDAPGDLTGGSADGQFGTVAGTSPGTVTYVSTDDRAGPPPCTGVSYATPERWLGEGTPPCGNGTFTIDNTADTIMMSALGGGQPSEMISPFVKDGGQYLISNASVPNFNAYIIGTGTFELDLTGVTANTSITSVTFSFGTGPETKLTDTTPIIIPEVPEPGSLALVGVAGLLLAFVLRRRAH